MPYEQMFQIIEKKDPIQLGKVAQYCARDAEACIYLLERLTTVLELRLFGALTRTPVYIQAFCGQQKKIINKLKEKCDIDGWVINNYKKLEIEGTYQGACVIEPVSGYHDQPVACLDYASLYPSIMIASNICFSTIALSDEDKKKQTHAESKGVEFLSIKTGIGTGTYAQSFKGVLPALEQELLAARKRVKKEMKQAKNKIEYSVLNARQLSIKVLCNSMYGFVGVTRGFMQPKSLGA